jgi:hypothetical protein
LLQRTRAANSLGRVFRQRLRDYALHLIAGQM